MYATDLLLKVPKSILLTGIFRDDGKPISAIAWKVLLSIMYFFPKRDQREIAMSITILHMMFGYLDVQKASCGRIREYFQMVYYRFGHAVSFHGRIERFDQSKKKVLFKQLSIYGIYLDGIGFCGMEDHVWMDASGFDKCHPRDCLEFEAEIYRYMRHGNGKMIDYALEKPSNIKKLDTYELPGKQEMVDQQIWQLV